MIKRNKAILCALASIGIMTSVSTVKANAMTNSTTAKTTLKAYQVENLMYDLPYTIDLNLKGQIENTIDVIQARVAYNSLSDEKKHCVDPAAVSNLEHAEENIRRVYGDEIKAIDLVCGISALEHQVGYNKDTNSIENKSEVKSKKIDIQKRIQHLEDTYQEIDYSIRFKNGLPDFMNELTQIELKVAGLK